MNRYILTVRYESDDKVTLEGLESEISTDPDVMIVDRGQAVLRFDASAATYERLRDRLRLVCYVEPEEYFAPAQLKAAIPQPRAFADLH